MAEQPSYDPLEKSEFFDDQRASRPLVEGTVARGHLGDDEHLYHGLIDGKPANSFPFKMDKQALLRGQERYNIFLDKYPQVVKQVTQKQIASYLGITPEFLSMIRGHKTRKAIS